MKRIISILLAVMLIASAVITTGAYSLTDSGTKSVEKAISEYETTNKVKLETNRYYFMMPDGKHGQKSAKDGAVAPSWYNDYTKAAAIYWWSALDCPNPKGWVGYSVKADSKVENLYYADVPKAVTTIVWNNGVDGGLDTTKSIYYKAAQTKNIGCEYYDPGECDLYPDGVESFNNMIFIIDPDQIGIEEFSKKQTCGGEWYYYYGDGCYGTVKGGEKDVAENCLNPDHNHDVMLGDVDLDGEISVIDATIIQKYVALMVELEDNQKAAADVDGDTFVSVMDATRIQKYKAQLLNLDGTKYKG